MWTVGLLSVSFFLHVLAVDRRLHERLCCHAAPFIDNNGIHGWFIAWGHEYFFLPITRIIFLSRIIELSNFNHTEYHGQSRIFFFLFLSRIIEFSNFNHTEYHGRSRIFFFFSCPELSNFRIFVFTRNIADGHGFLSSFFSCPEFSNFRILSFCPETCPWTHWPTGGNYRIFVFRDLPRFSVWLKENSLIRKFVTKIIPCEKPPGMHW